MSRLRRRGHSAPIIYIFIIKSIYNNFLFDGERLKSLFNADYAIALSASYNGTWIIDNRKYLITKKGVLNPDIPGVSTRTGAGGQWRPK